MHSPLMYPSPPSGQCRLLCAAAAPAHRPAGYPVLGNSGFRSAGRTRQQGLVRGSGRRGGEGHSYWNNIGLGRLPPLFRFHCRAAACCRSAPSPPTLCSPPPPAGFTVVPLLICCALPLCSAARCLSPRVAGMRATPPAASPPAASPHWISSASSTRSRRWVQGGGGRG